MCECVVLSLILVVDDVTAGGQVQFRAHGRALSIE